MTRELLSNHQKPANEPIRVLFASMPLDEHVLPMTSLAMALKEAGCDVRWYTQSNYASIMAELDIPHFPFRTPPQFHSGNLEAVFPARSKTRSTRALLKHDLRELFIRRGPEYYEDLKEIHREFPFTVMVADLGFTGIPFVNRLLKVPVIGIGLHPLKESSSHLAPYGYGAIPAGSRLSRLSAAWKRWVQAEFIHRGAATLQHRLHLQYGIRGSRHVHDDVIRHSTMVLQTGSPGFEYLRHDMSDHIRFCGPILERSTVKEKYWMGHHGTYEHTILVSLDKHDKDALAALVSVPEIYCNSNARVIVVTHGHDTSAMKQRFACSNVMIEDDVDLDDVMPYADVLVCSGRHQDVMRSIRHQLPMVVLGGRSCRRETGARVGYFKLGMHLRTDKPSLEQLKKGIDEVLREPGYRHRTRDLCEEFRQFNPEAMVIRYVRQLARGFRVVGSNLKIRPIDF